MIGVHYLHAKSQADDATLLAEAFTAPSPDPAVDAIAGAKAKTGGVRGL